MTQKKVTVKALQPFSHGNVDARQDGVYAMNAGDAKALAEAGFAEIQSGGDAEQTQNDHVSQEKQVGDVVVDAPGGGEKAAPELDNKAAPATKRK